ncbi:MAG: integration host factor subunit beta [Gemmatimonadetes bacterium]|nr:integration host factor subunit beta [Gemmatimonadota bacterium]
MTKANLVEQAAAALESRVTKRDCGLVVDAFLDAVKDTLVRGDHIEIRGFGTFKVRHRKARTARNPKTGAPVEVPAWAAPVFQPSILFLSRVDRGQRAAATREKP